MKELIREKNPINVKCVKNNSHYQEIGKFMKELIREKNPINVNFVHGSFQTHRLLEDMRKFIKKIELIANIVEKLLKMMFNYKFI